MSIVNQLKQKLRFRGRTFLAMVLSPELPIDAWFEEVDRILKRSPGFFASRPIILDCSGIEDDEFDIKGLLLELKNRKMSVMGLEGIGEEKLDPDMPPIVAGGRNASDIKPDNAVNESTTATKQSTAPKPVQQNSAEQLKVEESDGKRKSVKSLLIGHSVRSGQAICHTDGDVTIVGSVASGAEVIAGGSLHVYGTLRGRGMAGTVGDKSARIFCTKLEAELVAINGIYKAAEDIDPKQLSQSVQINLENDNLVITNL